MCRCLSKTLKTLGLVCLFGMSPESARLEDGVIGPGIQDRLAVAPRVRVLIFIEVSPVPPSRKENSREEISKAQDRILGSLNAKDFTLQRRFAAVPALVGEVSASGLLKLADLPGILRVDLDEGGTGHLAEAIPLTNVDDVQALEFTGLGVTVAILDSGVDTDHPDLADDLDGQACFCSGGGGCCPNGTATQFGAGAAEDNHGHGSNVAGIVTSGGVVAHSGVAPDAKIVAIKVLDQNNSFCCSSDVVAGLDWIITDRPDVDLVNMSLGTSALFSGNCDNATAFTLAFASAINTLRAGGVTTFASAGNNGSGLQMTAPACVANALSVGAVWDSNVGPVTILGCTDSTTAADKVTCFSNSDSVTDLFAPGAPITSDWLLAGTSTFYGTSQASPVAAGCAADLLQAYPALTPAQIETTLEATGIPVTDATNGLTFPRIDCLAAFDSLICNDTDADGYGSPGVVTCPTGSQADCNDLNAAIRPGAPQVCDGINNDCDHPGWPSLVGTNEGDDDADTYSECQGDCNDASAGVWFSPVEVANMMAAGGGPTNLSWDSEGTQVGPETSYDLVSGSLAASVDFASGTCLQSGGGSTYSDTRVNPGPGTGYWYVVRARNSCGVGTYGSSQRDSGILSCP